MRVHQMHVVYVKCGTSNACTPNAYRSTNSYCVFSPKQAKNIELQYYVLCVRMPVFVIKCYVRQMRHCKVCLKGRGFWGGGVSPPPKKFLYETLVDVV